MTTLNEFDKFGGILDWRKIFGIYFNCEINNIYVCIYNIYIYIYINICINV